MKRVLLRLAILLDGVAVGLMLGLLMSTEQRLKISQQLAPLIEGMAAQMPDG